MHKDKFIEIMAQLPEFASKSRDEILAAKDKLAKELGESPERFPLKEAYQFFANIAKASAALTEMEKTSKRVFADPDVDPSNPIGKPESPTSVMRARPGQSRRSGHPSRGPEHLAEERIDRPKRS